MASIFIARIVIPLLIVISTAISAGERPVDQLKTFLKRSRSLSADFKQIVINEEGNPVQTSTGVFLLQRPGKFRWDYEQPFEQQIVANSGKVWFYDKDLDQVTVKTLDESLGSTPALLLSGDINLEAKFTIEKQGVEDDMQWIKLLPKSEESSFKYITIGLRRDTLGGMELSDNFGQLTRIYFSNVLINPPIKPTQFQFKTPKGADVFSE